MRFDVKRWELVPFRTEDDLNWAVASCHRGQQGSAQHKKFRSVATATPGINVREVESVVSTGECGEPSSMAEAGSRIPDLDSGAGPAEAVAGASPTSPPGRVAG